MADWFELAECQYTDPDIFFPPDQPTNGYWSRNALKVCAGCTVRAECLAEALTQEAREDDGQPRFDRNFRHGVRGGLVPRERWQLAHPEVRKVA